MNFTIPSFSPSPSSGFPLQYYDNKILEESKELIELATKFGYYSFWAILYFVIYRRRVAGIADFHNIDIIGF